MKRILTMLIPIGILLLFVGCAAPNAATPTRTKDIAVLYTGDVHVAIDTSIGYAGVAQFKNELVGQGAEVVLVDTGDAIQGAPIGKLSDGEIPIDIMNELGYSAMALGNHEFDYGVKTLETLAQRANFPFLSLNFGDINTKEPIYKPYTIVEHDGVKIAFVGISTPKTITSSTPMFFKDEAGEFKYSFLQDDNGTQLWSTTQQAVDAARKEGAQYVVALAHLGIDESTLPYISPNLIANTNGIDVVLDGHSHSVLECERVQNKDGNRVLLSSTGTGLAHIGYLLIDKQGNISTGLVSNYLGKDETTTQFIEGRKAEFEEKLKQPVATVSDNLIIEDPTTGVRVIRNAETNLGNLCADAIRAAADTDVAFQNGGGIRAKMVAGTATYGDVLNVFPYANQICKLEVTGQQLLDALELSVSTVPSEYGGFLQVSGITFDFHTDIPSAATRDANGMFSAISGERRVHNVLIGGKPLNPTGVYTLAGAEYTLLLNGDGYTMFNDSTVLEKQIVVDYDAVINYLTTTYTANSAAYKEPFGEGRIVAVP